MQKDDVIYRQQAIDALDDIESEVADGFGFQYEKWRKHFADLPSAQPKTGKWINGHWDGDSNFRIDGRGNCWYVRECSNCHEEIEGKPTKYCPNCGCRMLMEGEEHAV